MTPAPVATKDALASRCPTIAGGMSVVSTGAVGLPTVDKLKTTTTYPKLTGTIGSSAIGTNTFTVEVDDVTYTKGDGKLSVTGSKWTLEPNEIKEGAYDVEAKRLGDFTREVKANVTIDSETKKITGTIGTKLLQEPGSTSSDTFSIELNGVIYDNGNAKLSIVDKIWTLDTEGTLPGTYEIKVKRGGTIDFTDSTNDELNISPQIYPILLADFKPTGYNFTRLAVAHGFTYTRPYGVNIPAARTDVEGVVNIINLVVSGTTQGKLVTIDISDPAKPVIMGEVSTSSTVRDIAVSKDVGLAYVTTYNSIQVYDIKDPWKPQLLNEITSLPGSPGADGQATSIPIGETPAIVEKGGWVYLANMTKGMRTLDLDPVSMTLTSATIRLANRITDAVPSSVALDDDVKFNFSLIPLPGTELSNPFVTIKEDGTNIWGPQDVADSEDPQVVQYKAKETARLFDPGKKYEFDLNVNEKKDGMKETNTKIERITLEWPVMVTDYNRDKKIDEADWTANATGKPFYFWINDDKDKGEVCSDCDIPGSGKNFEDAIVNGMSDLEDFFPVYLDLNKVLSKFSNTTHDYYLKQKDGALNFVFTDLTAATAGSYLTDPASNQLVPTVTTGPAKALVNRDTYPITGKSVRLNDHSGYSSFLNDILTGGKGIILVEGRKATHEPLVLEVIERTSNAKVFSSRLEISIDGVESMFRQKNLIHEMYYNELPAGSLLLPTDFSKNDNVTSIDGHKIPGLAGPVNRLTEEEFGNAKDHFKGFNALSNATETLSDGGDFVHVHGYNVNADAARAEHTQVFKRLFWSGSRARFWGITWYGYDSQQSIPLVSGLRSPNYHVNVRHAFNAGKLLKKFALDNSLGTATFSAHSLGNIVVSTAIQNTMPYYRYLMINAAVAEEAYLERSNYTGESWNISTRELMYNPDWRYPKGEDNPYEPFLWQSEWYDLFGSGDARSNLTWRNNFSSSRDAKVYTFFAQTDEAFRPFPLTVEELKNVTAVTDPVYDGEKSKTSIWLTIAKNWVASWFDSERIGDFGWSYNELMKGTDPVIDIDSKYGGWGFNKDANDGHYVCSISGEERACGTIPPATANLLDREPEGNDPGRDILKTKPFFDKRNTENSALFTPGQISTMSSTMREKLLANEIPALTFAVGHRGVDGFNENNIDIRAKYLPAGAPWVRDNNEWRHSDFINVAYPYLYLMYDDLKNKSQTYTGGVK